MATEAMVQVTRQSRMECPNCHQWATFATQCAMPADLPVEPRGAIMDDAEREIATMAKCPECGSIGLTVLRLRGKVRFDVRNN